MTRWEKLMDVYAVETTERQTKRSKTKEKGKG
jgi:hypothetical protein